MNDDTRFTLYSFLAYQDFLTHDTDSLERKVEQGLLSVQPDLGFMSLSWGPAAHRDTATQWFSDSLAYGVQEPDRDGVAEYTLVIRGTNPVSLQSWLFQDLDVGGMVPWSRRSAGADCPGAFISRATDRSLDIHDSLRSRGVGIRDWLAGLAEQAGPEGMVCNVTGHSLGGCLATALGLWLHEDLEARGLGGRVQLRVHALAGPTAGNRAWVEYLNRTLPGRVLCVDNLKDIAPRVWVEKDMTEVLPGIYPGIPPKTLESAALTALQGAVRGLGYAKPLVRNDFPSGICTDGIFARDYLAQAGWQHVVPYLERVLPDAPLKVADMVIRLLEDLVKDIFGSGGSSCMASRLRSRRAPAGGVQGSGGGGNLPVA